MLKLKSYWKGRNVALQMIYCKLTDARIPIRASIQITKYCNLKCPYCYATNNNPNVKERTTEEWFALFDELYSRGTRWLCILGGEPLMRKDIDDIIDYAKKKDMYIEMATNGWFIKDHIFSLKKVDHLFISIDGDAETCDKSRGPGTYKKIIEGINALLENGINFRLHAVLTKFSANSFDHIVELSDRYNVPANISEPGVTEDKMHLLLPEAEMLKLYEKVQSLKKKGHKISSPDIALKYLNDWPLPYRNIIYESDPDNIKNKVYPCYMKHRNCFIDVDGGFYACGRAWGKGLNIYKDGFEKCWEYLKNLDCYSCRNLGALEQSLILSANPEAIVNALRKYVL